MAGQYDNNMTGVLFVNDDKRGDKHPDYRGQCEIDGEQFWLSGWKKKNRDGSVRLSLAIKRKDDKQDGKSRTTRVPEDMPRNPVDEDIPF